MYSGVQSEGAMNKRKAYTVADEELIIRLRGEGLSESQIAKEMGRTQNSIHCKVREMREAGKLSPVRETAKISHTDLETLAAAHFTTVAVVEYFQKLLKTNKYSSLEKLDAVLLNFHANGKKCPYFGVEIVPDATKGMFTAVLTVDDLGRPMVVSKQAKRMRGKLSHKMFVKVITTIYEHLFTPKR